MMNRLDPHGRGMAADILALELARARQRINRAKLALESAEEMLDEDCGVAVNLALCSTIRSAQRRVLEARKRLTRIDPASMN